MIPVKVLDLLDEFLEARNELFIQLSQANLLLTRFKLNFGIEGCEMLLTVLNSESIRKDKTPLILNKFDRIDGLKVTFSDILCNRLIPLIGLKVKLEEEMNSQ